MQQSVATHRRATFHQLRWTVDYQYAADELRTALLNASRSAPFGKRGERQRQLEKNVQSLSNCAPETFVELLFKAQDLGVAMETLLRVPETIAALIRARRPRTQQLCIRELLATETQIESATNVVQWAYGTGDRSTRTARELLDDARKNVAIWQNIQAELERECFAAPARAAS